MLPGRAPFGRCLVSSLVLIDIGLRSLLGPSVCRFRRWSCRSRGTVSYSWSLPLSRFQWCSASTPADKVGALAKSKTHGVQLVHTAWTPPGSMGSNHFWSSWQHMKYKGPKDHLWQVWIDSIKLKLGQMAPWALEPSKLFSVWHADFEIHVKFICNLAFSSGSCYD